MTAFAIPYTGTVRAFTGANLAYGMKEIMSGAVADFINTDPREEKLQEFLAVNPELVNAASLAITAGMTADTTLYNKAMGSVEGALLGMSLPYVGKALSKATINLSQMFKNYGFARGLNKLGRYRIGLSTEEIFEELPKLPTEELKAVNFIPHQFQGTKGQKAYNEIVKENMKDILKAKGSQSMGEIDQAAKVYVEEVLQNAKGKGISVVDELAKGNTPLVGAAHNRALTQVTEGSLEMLDKASGMFLKGKMSPNAFATIKDETLGLVKIFESARSNTARALKAFDQNAFNAGTPLPQAGKRLAIPAGSGKVLDPKKSLSDAANIANTMHGENLKDFAKEYKKLYSMNKKAAKDALKQKAGNPLQNLIYWRNAQLLTNPITFAKNITSTTAEIVSAITDLAFEEGMNTITGVGPVTRGETASYVRGMFEGLGDSLQTAAHNLRNAAKPDEWVPIFSDAMTKTAEIEKDLVNIGPAKGTLKFLKYALSGRVGVDSLNVSDQAFKMVNYRGALRQYYRRLGNGQSLKGADLTKFINDGITNITDEAHAFSLERARTHTFTKKRAGTFGSFETFARSEGFLGADRLFLPFLGTNLNVLERKLARTPILGMGIKAPGTDILSEAGRRQRQVSQQITGLTMFGAATAAIDYIGGKIQGALPKDMSKAAAMRQAGIQENSLIIGNESLSLNPMEPLGGVVTFLGDIQDMTEALYDHDYSDPYTMQKVNAIAAQAASTMIEYYTPEFMTGAFGAIIESANKGTVEPLRHFMTGIPASFVPYSSLVRYIQKPSYEMETRTGTGLDMWMDDAMAKVQSVVDPKGLNVWAREAFSQLGAEMAPEGLPPKLNMFGEVTQASNGVFSKRELDTDPVMMEIFNLAQASSSVPNSVGDMALRISSVPRNGSYAMPTGESIPYALDLNQYYTLKKYVAGRDIKGVLPLKDKLSKLYSSNDYKKAPLYKRVAQTQTVIEAYRNAGMQRFLFTGDNLKQYKDTLKTYLLRLE